MATCIYLDKTLKDGMNINDFMDDKMALVYITDKFEDIFSNRPTYQNIDKDIDIIDKDTVLMNIPYARGNSMQKIQAILENDKLILYIKDHKFSSFLTEKLCIEKSLSSKYALLSVFEYLCMIYNTKLLKMDEFIDGLFAKAVTKNEMEMEIILKNKKIYSNIKRFVNYYKSMITYLDEIFNKQSSYKKVFFSFNYTLQMVDDVESSIYSCIEIYNSIYSNKMNQTMELLTIITVIALPATIITSAFGMNFETMPLVLRPEGFTMICGIILIIAITVVAIFKWKKYM